MNREAYAITIKLTTGERHVFSKLGYDTEPLEKQIASTLRTIRKKAIASVKQLDERLNMQERAKAVNSCPMASPRQWHSCMLSCRPLRQ